MLTTSLRAIERGFADIERRLDEVGERVRVAVRGAGST